MPGFFQFSLVELNFLAYQKSLGHFSHPIPPSFLWGPQSVASDPCAIKVFFFLADVPPSPTPEEERAPSPAPEPALKTELEPASTEVRADWSDDLLSGNEKGAPGFSQCCHVPQVSAGGRKRKRKRVLKSKMFIDEEEGCMGKAGCALHSLEITLLAILTGQPLQG